MQSQFLNIPHCAAQGLLNLALDSEPSVGHSFLGKKVLRITSPSKSCATPSATTSGLRHHSSHSTKKVWAKHRSMGTLLHLAETASENESGGVSPKSRLETGDGVLIVDHGSRRAESNAMLHEFVKMFKEEAGHKVVEAAHMELAVPTISDAFDRCVNQGATRIIISPYFLFPGRHWDKDIPALAAEAAKKHPQVSYLVTAPIGLHKLMVTVIHDRMEYCLSQVVGEAAECDMCKGSGRCKQLTTQVPQSITDTSNSQIENLTPPQ